MAEQQKHLTVNQVDLIVLRRCESYRMHQESSRGVQLTGKRSSSNLENLGSNPGIPANFYGRPDSRASQAVLKTVAA